MNINTAEHWNKAWAKEGAGTWRQYPECFTRIIGRIGTGKTVLDVGGGVGVLCGHLIDAGNFPYLVDISPVAIKLAEIIVGVKGHAADITTGKWIPDKQDFDYIVATEMMEHLTHPHGFLIQAVNVAPRAIFSVPNNILGPEKEPEHMAKYTPETFRELLEKHYSDVEIELFDEKFYTGKIYQVDNMVYPEKLEMPTILAYCEV